MMTRLHRHRIWIILGLMASTTTAVALVLYALKQNINLFYTPSELLDLDSRSDHVIRIGGLVVAGSVVRQISDLSVQFKLTDTKATMTVHYQGILPDLFREGQGIIAQGVFKPEENIFLATEVLAKHDENYQPTALVKQLAKQQSYDP